jgi:CHAT domain-containing protein
MVETAPAPLDPDSIVPLLLAADERQRADLLSAWATAAGLDALVGLLKQQADLYWGRDATVSLRLADAIVAVALAAGAGRYHALGIMARGDALRVLGHYEQSLAHFDEAASLFRACGDEVGWARTRIGRIASCLYLARPDEALADAAAARAILEAHGEWLFAVRVDINAAVVALHQGERERALALYDHALSICQRLNLPLQYELGLLYLNKALVLTDLGQLDAALALLTEAQAVFARRGESMRTAQTDAERARIHALRGEYTQALRLYRDACELLRRHGQAAETAIVEQGLVRCLLRLNQPSDALDQINLTIARLNQSPAERAEAQILRSLAHAYLGEYAAALADLDEAEAALTRLRLAPDLCIIPLQRAEIFWAQGEARQCFRAAAAASRRFHARGLPIFDWHARLLAARALAALGRPRAAGRLATTFLADAQAPRLPWLAQTAHHLLGQLAEAYGDLPVAAGHYARAMTALEAVSSRLLMDLRGHYLADKLAVYRDAVAVCLARGDVAGAYQCAERARGRALVEHLAANVDIRPRAREAADAPLVDELTALRRERTRLAALVEAQAQDDPGEGDAPPGVSPAEVERALADHEQRIAVLWQRLQARHPAYAAPSGLAVAAPAPPGALLAPGTLLIAYFEGRDGLLAFAADHTGLTVHRLPASLATLDRPLRLLRLNLDRAAVTARDATDGWTRQTTQARHLLGALYRDLLAPLAERLAGQQRLVIVPHGSLHYVPFAALHDGAQYLCQRLAVSVLPAAALLRPETTPPLLAPTALVLAHSQGGRLPQVTAEAACVAGLFPAVCALEEQAARAVLERDAPRHAIIHLAAHAGFRADAPLFSSISLADGPFDAVDVLDLTLDCSLVTLSACETGRSAILAGDELIGLSRAFLYAGARSLLLTLWRVDDAATNRFMQAFYTALRFATPKAEAVRQAQAAMAAEGQHPFFWAAFVLIGEAGAL